MPQNAVHRLQKLHNDIKAVLSIIEVAKSCHSVRGPLRKRSTISGKPMPAPCKNGILQKGCPDQADKATDCPKKAVSFIPRPTTEDYHFHVDSSYRMRCTSPRKPGSAPSQMSCASSACEDKNDNNSNSIMDSKYCGDDDPPAEKKDCDKPPDPPCSPWKAMRDKSGDNKCCGGRRTTGGSRSPKPERKKSGCGMAKPRCNKGSPCGPGRRFASTNRVCQTSPPCDPCADPPKPDPPPADDPCPCGPPPTDTCLKSKDDGCKGRSKSQCSLKLRRSDLSMTECSFARKDTCCKPLPPPPPPCPQDISVEEIREIWTNPLERKSTFEKSTQTFLARTRYSKCLIFDAAKKIGGDDKKIFRERFIREVLLGTLDKDDCGSKDTKLKLPIKLKDLQICPSKTAADINNLDYCQKAPDPPPCDEPPPPCEKPKKRFTCNTKAEELQRCQKEKKEFQKRIDCLQSELDSSQKKVAELECKVADMECQLKKLSGNLKEKTARLEDTSKELESIRDSSRGLERQVKSLGENVETFERVQQSLLGKAGEHEADAKRLGDRVKRLEEENGALRASLDEEKDAHRIKVKIIEDQQETIKRLREKSDEARTVMNRNLSLERLINLEREEKLELQDAVEKLKRRKDELKRKLKALEKDVLAAPQEVVRDLQRTQVVLRELEQQVQVKQKEWESHLELLVRQKDQACSVAELATKKLIETSNEFQKQSEANKRLHRALFENIAEREKCLRDECDKIGVFNYVDFY